MKFVMVLSVVVIFVTKSFALECYTCDSDFEHNCHSMYDRNVRTEHCDERGMIGYQRNVCLKTVSFEYGNRKTVRGCARAGPRKDPCFERRNSIDLSVCEVCDDHLCNSSMNLTTSFWVTILPMIALLSIKKLF